ncbi:hypothetical protein [Paractinoplanes maris]|uniref:hypothetical protein n=1 Tax=Paractinoplanes maris TaxID=1734446 RepID=UPI0020210E9C|nr:hypothetical protein [Actinoplanes maris]
MTAGFAHHADPPVRTRKAVVLCTAGYTAAELNASGVLPAMRTTMVTDRIGSRAAGTVFQVLGGTSPDARREHLRTAAATGRDV